MLFFALFAPTAGQCARVAGPVAGVLGLIWLTRHGHLLVDRLFPHLAWERQLGWMNLQAYRRAESALRWLRYSMHAVLLLALAGLLGDAWLFGKLLQPGDPLNVIYLALLGTVFLGCLVFWVAYLTLILAPKIRDEYEREELERFRAENPDAEETGPTFGLRLQGGITIWDSPVDAPRRPR